ncbi:rab-like protein 3 [Anthonomus grandis grandis]|uniref:rab-like protein 3 n=1 Tax=Anthonomus grandis grandis TaxID=2921223 RepID=UPI002166A8D3|nr:rab-like protein 3 [Anthonomus grandis grandis]
MTTIERVRIMVLGDSGVGKTSFVHLAAHNEPVKSPSWTIGCSVEVKLHEYKEGTRDQKTFFIEFWDVGGSKIHSNARKVFYHPCHGAILVHDLSNRKSEENLQGWLQELLLHDHLNGSHLNYREHTEDVTDAENLLGMTNFMPILEVGTKLDQADEKRSNLSNNNSFRCKYNAEEILLDCRQARYLAAGTSNAVKLSRFYDKVIENKLQDRQKSFSERFKSNAISPIYSSKYYLSHHD